MSHTLTKRMSNLPAKPGDLQRWILIGKVKLKAQIAAIKAIRNLEEGMAAKEAALSDTQDLAEELLYAEARLGEMLAAQDRSSRKRTPDGKVHGQEQLPSGIDKKQSHYAQQLSKNEDKIAEVVAEAREKGEVPVRQTVLKKIFGTHVSQNSGVSEWYTPQEYIEAAKQVMGAIDIDPATTKEVNKHVGAKIFFTKENSGLDKKWLGRVWMNPPYAQPLVSQFCNAFADKYNSGETTEGCVLINNTTETAFGQRLLGIASAVCFPSGRVPFLDKNGNPGAPLQGQMIIYCGEKPEVFVDVFSQFGVCLCAGK